MVFRFSERQREHRLWDGQHADGGQKQKRHSVRVGQLQEESKVGKRKWDIDATINNWGFSDLKVSTLKRRGWALSFPNSWLWAMWLYGWCTHTMTSYPCWPGWSTTEEALVHGTTSISKKLSQQPAALVCALCLARALQKETWRTL